MVEAIGEPKGREVTMPQRFLIISHVLTIMVTAYLTAFFHETLRVSSDAAVAQRWRAGVVQELENTRSRMDANQELLGTALPRIRALGQEFREGKDPEIGSLSLPIENAPVAVWEHLQAHTVAMHLPVDWYLEAATLYSRIQIYNETKTAMRAVYQSLNVGTRGGSLERSERQRIVLDLENYVNNTNGLAARVDLDIRHFLDKYTETHPMDE